MFLPDWLLTLADDLNSREKLAQVVHEGLPDDKVRISDARIEL